MTNVGKTKRLRMRVLSYLDFISVYIFPISRTQMDFRLESLESFASNFGDSKVLSSIEAERGVIE